MKKILTILFAVSCLGLSSASYAVVITNGGQQDIGTIIPNYVGTSVIFLGTNNTSCARPYYLLEKSYRGFKENYAILLLASSKKRKVTVVTDGCSTLGDAIVVSIQLHAAP